MGGNVEVDSEGIGKGTTFIIKMRAISKVDSLKNELKVFSTLCSEEV